MKNMKSVLALVMALCLMLCLAVPAFATETTEGTIAETTAAAADTTAAAEDTTAAAEDTTAATEDTAEVLKETVDEHEGHDHADEEASTETIGEAKPENVTLKVIRVIVIVLEVIASIALIAVIMMQSGKEAGLGSIAGNTDSYMNKGNVGSWDKKLASFTKWVAIAWIILTLVLSLLPNA